MKDRILIVIPAHNEAENITAVIQDINKHLPRADILVIDDSSTDKTAQLVRDSGVKCITTVFNLRYAMAVQTGIKYAEYNNYDYVLQMDADGQHLASEAYKLYQEIKSSDMDIVIGSRYIEGGEYEASGLRKKGAQFFSAMIKLLCKQSIADPLSGFQCLNRRAIDYCSVTGNYPEYPDAGFIIDLLSRGYRIAEVPVKMALRTQGESMHSGIIQPISYMITQFYTCIIIFIKHIGRRMKNE